ncbi:polysaccharide export outer membrane protein [Paraburkholderia caballeronis]|uniref:polysaccharide biosynthesis/export family protein n=1 Tax=Paraburkholderia caballeronis TaxID=416943 RepID=UPI0010DBD248|nr:polysaccharide biosynthesis/export family protein [Paraburkholderia caballeronis]TDV37323.1 polysaccharide export outer membrane protein [Paraburkholderia caballeronis]
MLMTAAGCGSLLSSAGPSRQAISGYTDETSDAGAAYKLVDLSAATIGAYMRPADPVPAREVLPPSAPEVRLVPGDMLKITIADNTMDQPVFAPLSSGGTSFNDVRVGSKGTISLPYVGDLPVEGMTLHEVERNILGRLKGKVSVPVVRVELSGDISSSVLVVGAVKTPGRVSALKGPLTLLDAINSAGGPVLEPHLIRVVVRTGKGMQIYNYNDLLHDINPVIPPHSEIIVERDRKRFVAMGAVGTPGLHDLPSENPSLLETLGSVGGLQERMADASGVFIFRLTHSDDGKPQAEVFRLNMKRPEAIFLAEQFLVRPEDAIYVTNAAVYEWQKIITPIVQVLVLGRNINDL